MSLIRRRLFSRVGNDSGQLPTALMILVFVGLLILIFWVGLPFGQAIDQKAASRSAADAAALAAGENIKEHFGDDLADALPGITDADQLPGVLDFLIGGYGLAGAQNYAELNKAEVTGYRFSRGGGLGPAGRGQIQVTVAGDAKTDRSTNERSRSVAYANLGFRLGTCTLRDDDPPPTTEEEDPPPPPDDDAEPTDPPPPPDTGTTVTCGDLVLHFTIGGEDGHPRLDDSLDDLQDRFEIKLTG